MLGVELVTDRQLKTPANAEILHVMEHMKGNLTTYCHFLFCFLLLLIHCQLLRNYNNSNNIVSYLEQIWVYWSEKVVFMEMFSE